MFTKVEWRPHHRLAAENFAVITDGNPAKLWTMGAIDGLAGGSCEPVATDGCLVGNLDSRNPLTSQTWLSRTAMATDIFMAGRVPNSYFADRDTQRTACAAGTFADPHLSQSTTSFCTLCPVGKRFNRTLRCCSRAVLFVPR